MYQFSENLNHDVFFRFDKKWIENMNWALLPKTSKAILPVIGIHCDPKGHSFPSERTIAILAGISDKSVREGIQGLLGFPGFEVSRYISSRGRRAKKYHLTLPPEREKNRSFFFHRVIVDGGNWSELKLVSQALYCAMRYFAYFDQDIYCDETEDTDLDDFNELYKNRKWELCSAEKNILAKYAGLSRPSVDEALKDLEKKFLIESFGRNDEGELCWKVFLIPPKYFKRDFLNGKIKKAYRHEKNSV